MSFYRGGGRLHDHFIGWGGVDYMTVSRINRGFNIYIKIIVVNYFNMPTFGSKFRL